MGTRDGRGRLPGRLPRRWIVLGLVALLPVGCALKQEEPSTHLAETVSATVANESWHDVRIYALNDAGARRPLGTLTSMTSQTYRLPRVLLSAHHEIRFVAHPIGVTDFAFVSQAIPVSAGTAVSWRIHNNRALTAIDIRR